MPAVHLHNPVLAYENGDEFMAVLRRAAVGELGPFILVVEGSFPDESTSREGCWAGIGLDQAGQPIPTTRLIDQLAPNAWAVVAAGTCATYGGIHAVAGNPTGCMGLPSYLGWNWTSPAGVPIVCLPGCPIRPDNFMETLAYLLRQATGAAPDAASFKGIDVMRTVRGFDPCLPCGVHLYTGGGKVVEVRHSPMFGLAPVALNLRA